MTLVEIVATLAIAGLATAMVAGSLRPHAVRTSTHAVDVLKEGIDRAVLLARSGSIASDEPGTAGNSGVVTVTLGREITAARSGEASQTRSILPRGWRAAIEGSSSETADSFILAADGSAPDVVLCLEHKNGTPLRIERLGLSGQWRELGRSP